VIVIPVTSKYAIPVRVPNDAVYMNTVNVAIRSDYWLLGLLSSGIHHAWIMNQPSTLNLSIRYNPTDYFETFPLPRREANVSDIDDIMVELENCRGTVLVANDWGLTEFYNEFHNESVTDETLEHIRSLHTALDAAVLKAYGWRDVVGEYRFHVSGAATRWTLSGEVRAEIIARLLDLNHDRHRQEAVTGESTKVWQDTDDSSSLERNPPSQMSLGYVDD
jgi:hypothetical protein